MFPIQRMMAGNESRRDLFGFQDGNGNGHALDGLTGNERREAFDAVINAYLLRDGMIAKWLDPRRDYDKECGYPDVRTLSAETFRRLYDEDPIARRIVELFPKECWQRPPDVYEDENPEVITEFEQAWLDLCKSLRRESWFQDQEGNPVWEHLARVDKLSRVGQYGALLLGLDDSNPLYEPVEGVEETATYPFEKKKGEPEPSWPYGRPERVLYNLAINAEKTKGRQLRYLRSFSEDLADVVQWEGNPSSPRYCEPVMYSITLNDPSAQAGGVGIPTNTVRVHWTRVLHVADCLDSSENLGVPACRPLYKRIIDLTKLYGGSAEMYWSGAFPGVSLSTHPQLGGDVAIDQAGIREQMKKWYNGLQRWMTFSGMSAQMMSPTVVDPTSQINVQIEAICILLGIPIRIFKGSERGELASSMDDTTWTDRVRERCYNYLTPRLIVPFIDRLIMLGVLPEPKARKKGPEGKMATGGYSVVWPDLKVLSKTQQATLAGLITTALSQYIAGGVDAMIEPLTYLTEVVGWEQAKAKAYLDATMKHVQEANPEAENPIPGAAQTLAPPAPEMPPEAQGREPPQPGQQPPTPKKPPEAKQPTNAELADNEDEGWEDLPAPDGDWWDDTLGPVENEPSFFATCQRDKEGHCLPAGATGGAGSEGGGKVQPNVQPHKRRKRFDKAEWQAKAPGPRIKEWNALDIRERDRLANAENSVGARIGELLEGAPPRPKTGNLHADLHQRVNQFSDRLTRNSSDKIKDVLSNYGKALHLAGVDKEHSRKLAMEAADHLVAQELEACGRQLGDHGINHIAGNIKMAGKILQEVPSSRTKSAKDRAIDHLVMQTAMIYHDTGYLTPPSQNFLDEGHPRWSQDYFDAKVRPMVAKALGTKTAREISNILPEHDSNKLDWDNDPVGTACRVADNLSLFQEDKLPPVFRHVPGNLNVLKRLGQSQGSEKYPEEKAKQEMRDNIDAADLPVRVKEQMHRAVDEVSVGTYKYTVGMLGGTVKKVSWQGAKGLAIELKEDKVMTELHQWGDFGQRQFLKFAESYDVDPDEFKRTKHFAIRDKKKNKPLMDVVMNERLVAILNRKQGGGGSFFGQCERDPKGHCMAKGGVGMISPSIDDIDYDEAKRRLDSPRQKALQERFAQVDAALGVRSKSTPAVGAWKDGAENSTIVEYPADTDWDTMVTSACMKGLLAEQKAVLAFKPEPGGKDSLWKLKLKSGDDKGIHEALLNAGIENHTLTRTDSGYEVTIYDEGHKLAVAVRDFALQGDAHVENTQGKGEFIGSWTSREEGAAEYRRRIGEFARSGKAGRKAARKFERIRRDWLSNYVRNRARAQRQMRAKVAQLLAVFNRPEGRA